MLAQKVISVYRHMFITFCYLLVQNHSDKDRELRTETVVKLTNEATAAKSGNLT
jgi:hypothetical protein